MDAFTCAFNELVNEANSEPTQCSRTRHILQSQSIVSISTSPASSSSSSSPPASKQHRIIDQLVTPTRMYRFEAETDMTNKQGKHLVFDRETNIAHKIESTDATDNVLHVCHSLDHSIVLQTKHYADEEHRNSSMLIELNSVWDNTQ